MSLSSRTVRCTDWLKWNSSLHFCAGQSFSSVATRLAADVWSSLCEVLPSINQSCDHVVSCGKRRPWNTPNLEKNAQEYFLIAFSLFVKWTCEIFTLTKGSGVWWDKISLRHARIRSQMDVGVQQAVAIYKMVFKMCWWCLDCLLEFYFIYMNTYTIIYEVNIRCSSTQQHIWSLTRIFNSRIKFDNSVGLLFGMGKNLKLVHISDSPWYFSISAMFLWQNLVVLSASRAPCRWPSDVHCIRHWEESWRKQNISEIKGNWKLRKDKNIWLLKRCNLWLRSWHYFCVNKSVSGHF